VDKFRFTPQQASDLIHGAGGLMVLAHPSTYKRDDEWLNQALDALKDLGLDGLEAYYSLHSEHQTEHYRSLAQKRGLFVTGGTDFHGKAKPDISLGKGKGNLSIPYHLLEKMKSEKSARRV
jgi:3',5'-nucleoside bisphosphate phosphatase